MPYEKVGKNEPVCIADEVPFEIPDSWEWVRLATANDMYTGNSINENEKKQKYMGLIDGYCYIGTKDVGFDHTINYDNGVRIPYSNEKFRIAPRNSILLCIEGGSAGRKISFTNKDICFGNKLCCFISYGVDYKFLYYYLQSPLFQSAFKENTGGIIGGVSVNTLKSLFLPVPPVEEQQRIVQEILKLEPYIEEYRISEETIAKLNSSFPEQLKKSILQEAVQGKIVLQNPADEPASVLLERIRAEKERLIKDGKIKRDKHESVIFRRDNSHYEKLDGIEHCIDDEIPFDLPESWRWVRLGYLLKIESGKPLTAKEMKPGTIPVYGGNGITGYHNDYLVDDETVVIGRVGYYCGSVHITESKAWITDNAFITTYPTGYIDRDYLVFTLRSMNLGQNNNATAQPVVSGKKIYPMLFPLPPLEEQKRIVAKLKEILPFCKII